MFQLNLKSHFERIGRDFATELKQAILNQKDLSGRAFAVIAKSTAWNRFYKANQNRKAKHLAKGKTLKEFKKNKGKAKFTYPAGLSLRRLMFTKDFVSNAFKSKANNESATIFVSEGNHKDPGTASQVSYAEIVRYNNRGSEEVNPKIVSPPLIFPTTPEEVKKMHSWKLLKDVHLPAMKGDIIKQIREQVQPRRVDIQL